jgi:hypothetical protein
MMKGLSLNQTADVTMLMETCPPYRRQVFPTPTEWTWLASPFVSGLGTNQVHNESDLDLENHESPQE